LWAVVRWYRSEGPLSASQMADAYATMLINGIVGPDGEHVRAAAAARLARANGHADSADRGLAPVPR
jgi:hypothetical protein